MTDGWRGLDEPEDEATENDEEVLLIRREAAIMAAAFKTPQGQKALALLREKTYGRAGRDLLDFTDRGMMESYMVHRDGQCSVMRMIDQMIGIDSGKIKVE